MTCMPRERPLRVLMFIMARHQHVFSADIVKEFGVSKRTVYRDMAMLQNLGFPIVGKPGTKYQDGGYQWVPDASWEMRNRAR
jgi:predicted DNA-binding transcriptional regulator YafY